VRTKGTPNPQGCEGASGPLGEIVNQLDGVDVVVSGHTHWAYICEWPGKNPAQPVLMTSAGVFGTLVTEISLEIDPRASRVVGRSARNVIVQSETYTPAPGRVSAVTDRFPRFTARADIADSSTGGTLGLLIADAQLAATAGAGAQIAFMNPFGIRAPWRLAPGENGQLTFGDIYKVQPFNNTLLTQTLTGAQLRRLLEQNFDGIGPNQVLSPSRGFAYSYDLSRPVGSRIVSITLDGKPIDDAANYRVTTSDFLAYGGDTYSELAKGTDRVMGISDLAALEAWLQAIPPRAVSVDDRARDVTPR